jgi:hypothetical protein
MTQTSGWARRVSIAKQNVKPLTPARMKNQNLSEHFLASLTFETPSYLIEHKLLEAPLGMTTCDSASPLPALLLGVTILSGTSGTTEFLLAVREVFAFDAVCNCSIMSFLLSRLFTSGKDTSLV